MPTIQTVSYTHLDVYKRQFMYSIVDGVKVERLSTLCQIELAGGCSVLRVNTHLKVLLGGVGHDLSLIHISCALLNAS